MFTLDDTTGAITIDFSIPSENPDVEDEIVKVVIEPPPTFGAYKRLRLEIERINRGRDELQKQLIEDDSVGGNEMTSRINGFTEDSILGWWRFVMVGDDTYRGQATSPPPESFDAWPLYLISNDSMQQALAHWKTVPLARGARPVLTTS